MSEIYNGGPYYTNIRDGYYQAQSQRALKRWTTLEKKASIALEEIIRALCSTTNTIVKQQEMQTQFQIQQLEKLKELATAKPKDPPNFTDLEKRALNQFEKEYGLDYAQRAFATTNNYGVVEIKYFDNESVPNTYYYGNVSDLRKMADISYETANSAYQFGTGGDLNKIGDNGLNNPDGTFKNSTLVAMYRLAHEDFSNDGLQYSDHASMIDAFLPAPAAIATNSTFGVIAGGIYHSNMKFKENVDAIPNDKEYAGILMKGQY